jgi:trimeric autotransporter adhesin
MAHSPVASADSSADWLSSIDTLLGGGALPAPSSGLDLAISFNGVSLLQDGSANAFTTSGGYDLAIAYGANSHAEAIDGTGDTAIASGSGATAFAYDGTGDYALADGTNAYADSGGATGANYDSAIDIGNNASTGTGDGAYAGAGALTGNFGAGTGSYDTAIDIGNNTNDASLGGNDGSFAGAGGLTGGSGDGNNDTAIDIGNNSGAYDGSHAVDGNGNYASESGSTTGEGEGVFSTDGNDNTAVADASYTSSFDGTYAYDGNDNYASVVGPENSYASAGIGDSNIAYVLDPFGSTASEATSGLGHSSDLAAVLLTDGNATASGANFLYDILTAFGLESGTF